MIFCHFSPPSPMLLKAIPRKSAALDLQQLCPSLCQSCSFPVTAPHCHPATAQKSKLQPGPQSTMRDQTGNAFLMSSFFPLAVRHMEVSPVLWWINLSVELSSLSRGFPQPCRTQTVLTHRTLSSLLLPAWIPGDSTGTMRARHNSSALPILCRKSFSCN